MTLPDSRITISDGALGTVDPNGRESANVGTCSSGTANTLYGFTEFDTLRSTLGYGPLVEAVAHKLAGGGTVYAMPVTPDTAGAAGAVTHTGTGTSEATVSGSVHDAFKVRITITRAGGSLSASPPATFTVSIDGGVNTSAPVPMPTSGVYPVPNTGGLIVTFAAGTFVLGDTFNFDCVAPLFTASTVTSALTALRADPRTWKHVHIVGGTLTVANARLQANAVDAALATAEAQYRFTYGIVECPNDTDANIIAGFATFASTRVAVGAGLCSVTSPLTGLTLTRNAALPFAARRHTAPIHEDAGRVESGALRLVTALARDEAITPGLDSERFVTLRSFIGKRGFYITNGNMMANGGSDFSLVQFREVMDVACSVQRDGMLRYVNENVRVYPSTVQAPAVAGAIDERDARAVESDVGGKLRAALVSANHVTDATITVNRTDNILSTRTLRSKVRVLPFGYTKFIESNMGFTNPALGVS